MNEIERKFSVDFQYRVDFTEDLFAVSNPTWGLAVKGHGPHPARCAVVVDDGVARHHPDLIRQIEAYAAAHAHRIHLTGPPTVVAGGEACKNDARHVDRILQILNDENIDRHAYVMAIGGGALLDMVGFAAGTCHRGVRLIRVPTTVLAQNDSGVGVKNSVNRFGKKNFLGTFAPPSSVLVDPAFLTTLDDRDWCAGTAEAVKVALLRDAEFFLWIEQHAAQIRGGAIAPMSELVHRCAELHVDHITTSGDPFESGSSRPLDFGHWAAHKLEQITDFELRHGEAVAIGLALDVAYSHLTQGLTWDETVRILDTLAALGLPLTHDTEFADAARDTLAPAVFEGLEEFRQHLGGELTIMLLKGIADGVEVHEIDAETMSEAARLVARREVSRDAPSTAPYRATA